MTQEYQNIQEQALQIMMRCKRIQAIVAQGDKQKIQDAISDLKCVANDLVYSYPDENARFIPYLEAMTTIMNVQKAQNELYKAVETSLKSLETLLPLTQNFANEQAATILTRQLLDAFNCVGEFGMASQEARGNMYTFSIPQDLAYLLLESMRNLAEINPNNVILQKFINTNIMEQLQELNKLNHSKYCSLQLLDHSISGMVCDWMFVSRK